MSVTTRIVKRIPKRKTWSPETRGDWDEIHERVDSLKRGQVLKITGGEPREMWSVSSCIYQRLLRAGVKGRYQIARRGSVPSNGEGWTVQSIYVKRVR